jgi:hypothetical protein
VILLMTDSIDVSSPTQVLLIIRFPRRHSTAKDHPDGTSFSECVFSPSLQWEDCSKLRMMKMSRNQVISGAKLNFQVVKQRELSSNECRILI